MKIISFLIPTGGAGGELPARQPFCCLHTRRVGSHPEPVIRCGPLYTILGPVHIVRGVTVAGQPCSAPCQRVTVIVVVMRGPYLNHYVIARPHQSRCFEEEFHTLFPHFRSAAGVGCPSYYL